MNRIRLIALSLIALPSFLGGCTPAEDAAALPSTQTRTDAIRNGTRDPQNIRLDEGQRLAVGWLHTAGRPSANFCTGTLVTPRVVATAQHCVEGETARRLGFGIGLLPTDPVATFAVSAVHAHPSVDAALLILAEDVTDRVPELVPIPFNRVALDANYQNRLVDASGFGETYDRTRTGRYFASVELIQVRRQEIVVDGHGQQGICFGDSGGPVMANIGIGGAPVVLGVESWGEQSCVGEDHLTRLDPIAAWIDGLTPDAEPGPDPEPDPEPEPNACGDLDFLGRCNGDVAEWCGQGQVQSRDCASQGLVCAYV
ncbi:MAG: trypsin-like serine protease, partial [Myxococcales bacterium]|nr:trypsin-like serine protease [Myxococcales bacterium]